MFVAKPQVCPVSALSPPGSLSSPRPASGPEDASCLLLLSRLRLPSLSDHPLERCIGRRGRRGKTPSSLALPPQACSSAVSARPPRTLPVPQKASFQHRASSSRCGPEGSGKMGISLSRAQLSGSGGESRWRRGSSRRQHLENWGPLSFGGEAPLKPPFLSFFQELVSVGGDSPFSSLIRSQLCDHLAACEQLSEGTDQGGDEEPGR